MSALVAGFVMRQHLGFIWLLAVCGFVAMVAQPSRCVAESEQASQASAHLTERIVDDDFARNIIKLRVTSALLINGLGFGYERAVTEWFTVGASIGTGVLDGLWTKKNTYVTGGDLVAFFMNEGDHKFVSGFGFSVNYTDEKPAHYENGWFGGSTFVETVPGSWNLWPVLSVGYRYQPAEGGLFFESGLGLNAGLNTGLALNLGYVF